jgi:hypothetical protein
MSNVLRWALEGWRKMLFVVTPTVAVLLILAFLAKHAAPWPFVGDLLESLAFVLIGVTLIELLLSLVEREKLREDINQVREDVTKLRDDVMEKFEIVDDAATTGLRHIFFPAKEWTPDLTGRSKVVIAGLRVRFVRESEEFRRHCSEILDRHGEVTLVMADPRSDPMWLRYREEPLPPPLGPDPVGQAHALEELASVLSMAYNWRQNREMKEKKDVSRFVLKVASNYPSHAYYLLDDELYVYHYPFKARGLDGPLFQFATTTETGKFLCSCLDRVVREAAPLNEATYQDIEDWHRNGRLSDRAVFASTSAGGVSAPGSSPSSTP